MGDQGGSGLRAKINPPAWGDNISTYVLVHVLRFDCRVRTVRAREAAVPEDPLFAHVSLCVPKIGFSGTAGPQTRMKGPGQGDRDTS